MKKWELTTNTKIKYGRTLTQIKAVISFNDVKKGDLGGWIESELSLVGNNAWVFEAVIVFKNSVIRGGEIWGGEIRGGEIWGGEIWGGEIRGGEIRGGEIWGGEIWGGEIRGGEIMGGVIMGGVIMGGEIWGGEIWGGEIRGGVIRGGEIRGGEIRGGEIWGGVIRGGEIRGGEIRGGVIRGGAKIESSDDFLEVSPIGSENGVLTIYKCTVGFNITRGCFKGTPYEFLSAVRKKHGRKKQGKIYRLVLDMACLKFGNSFKKALNGDKK